MTAAPTYLGVDVGTSMVKGALFDPAGEVVATAARPVPLSHPAPGRVEQDADAVVQAAAEVLGSVAGSARQRTGAAPEVVAVTGQGDGCWLVDGQGRPVRPAVSWMDGRADVLLDAWSRDGVSEAVFRINGNMLFPGAQAPILRWLDQHEPGTLDRATTAAYCKDVVVQRLTGLRATDTSDASLPFGDGAGGYSQDVLELCGLAHRSGLLPPVVQPLPYAPVTEQAARSTGLAPGTIVVTAPFDLPSCAVGGGVTTVGDGLLILGTTLACQVLVDAPDLAGEPAGMHLATPAPGRWLRAMPAMSGCASLDWTLSVLGLTHDALDSTLAASVPGAGGVQVLPYLAPSGERAPFVDPAARGQYTGLQLTTTREDLVRAMCEGLAHAARHCFEAAGLTGRLMVCGGGTRSRAWLQIFADVLNRPLHVVRGGEAGARGAVLAALEVTGRSPDVPAWTRPDTVVEPDPARKAVHEEGYGRYLERVRAARAFGVTA